MEITPDPKWEKALAYELERLKQRKPCPYGVVSWRGMPPTYCYVMHTLVLDDKYVLKDGIHPAVKKWIRNRYVEYEPYDNKTITLIVS